MLRVLVLILPLLLLTSCSNPDTSGGVTLSRGGDDANEFPHGSCEGQGKNPPGGSTGCGWGHSDKGSYYLSSCSNPTWYEGCDAIKKIFPYGSCDSQSADAPSSGRTGCGWITVYDLNVAYRGQYIMPGVNLNGVLLNFLDLNYADLRNAKLRGAEMYGTQLREANLTGSDMKDAKLQRAFLQNAQLVYVTLTDADLWSADLRGANLNHARLWGARLEEADLRDSSSQQIQLRHADIQHANLRGAKLDDQSWPFMHFIERASHHTTCPNGRKWGDPAADCNKKGLHPFY